MTGSLKGKTLFITGASRGIGKAIGLRAAKDGANIIVVAKTQVQHPKLPGTIYTAAEEMEKVGGQALAVAGDIRFEDQVEKAVQQGIQKFGGIDILVNNASAIHLTDTPSTPLKRFDLMFAVNVRGTFLCSQHCYPYLKKSKNPHILNLAPPLTMKKEWFSQHLAYTMSKFGMSECVLGMHEEFKEDGIAVNALWPKTTIATSAVTHVLGSELSKHSRKPQIVADAAYWILTQESKSCTGNFFIDENVLREQGITDFIPYSVDPKESLQLDLFVL
ncbi:MAG: NAD(P)-dependent oxidoreductase [Deltaproteobacteria bacterium]|nr:NAD(P)-dependent oxidoreductase [Deltaproteobacteria bacterium]